MRRREHREFTGEETEKLTRLSRSQTAAHREVRRATIIRMAAEGMRYAGIGETVTSSPDSVSGWVARCNDAGLLGLQDQSRPGRQRT